CATLPAAGDGVRASDSRGPGAPGTGARIAIAAFRAGLPSQATPAHRSDARLRVFVRQLATLGPVGFAPIAPATAASAVVTVIAWFLPVLPLPTVLVLLAVFTGFAVWAAGIAE